MPNWCSNDLYVYGKGRTEIVEAIAGEGDAVIDFEKIVPMPEALRDTSHGSREAEAKIINGMNDGSDMLGWSWIKKRGIENVEQLKAYLLGKCPELVELGEKLVKLQAEFGCTNWYDWSVENWGTKWNASVGTREERRTSFLLTFDTAWSPPTPIVKALSEKYPNNKFSLRYYEGGMGYKGHFAMKGGKIVADEYGKYRGRRGG